MNRRAFVRSLSLAIPLPRYDGAPPVTSAPGIWLANNENPYGPGRRALEAVRDVAASANRYPRSLHDGLIEAIATRHGVSRDHILLSGGSGDLMRAAVYAFTSGTKAFVTPRPTYEAPMRSAQHIGAPVVRVPLTSTLRLDPASIAARAAGAGLIYICNPNNPTGTAVTASDLGAMIARLTGSSPETRVLIDEAYLDYADRAGVETMVSMACQHSQVIVLRTFSKIHGMAGMRVGYAIAQPRTLAQLRGRHSRSSLSSMGLAAATAAVNDTAHVDSMVALNRTVRSMMTSSFADAGNQVADSDANFIFVNVERDVRSFQEACRLRGVVIGRAFPPLVNWARISVGTHTEMETAMPIFIDILRAAVPTRPRAERTRSTA